MFFHRFGDLVVESDIFLSTLPAAGAGPIDVSLCKAASGRRFPSRWDHRWLRPDGTVSLACSRARSGYQLGFPDLATATVDGDGRRVALRPLRRLAAETAEHLVVDQILPRVASYRGRLVLHAGCVAFARGAVAILGDSGAGKSTLCAAAARSGGALVGDDGVFVRPDEDSGGFAVSATYPGLRLHPPAIDQVWDALAPSAPVDGQGGKLRFGPESGSGAWALGVHPLRAIFTLDARAETGEVAVVPLRPQEAFRALLRGCFQLHLDDAERSRRQFEAIAALLDEVPVRALRYPRRLERLPDVVAAVERSG